MRKHAGGNVQRTIDDKLVHQADRMLRGRELLRSKGIIKQERTLKNLMGTIPVLIPHLRSYLCHPSLDSTCYNVV